MRNPSTNEIDEDRLTEKEVTGYANQWSVQQGNSIQFMVNCNGPDEYQADVVKIICGDLNPDGPGYKEAVVDTPINGTHTGRRREIYAGSHIRVPNAPPLQLSGSFTIQAMIYPTLPENGPVHEGGGRQGLLTKWSDVEDGGYGLFIGRDGDLELQMGATDGTTKQVNSGEPLNTSMWHFVAARYDANSERVLLYQEPLPENEYDVLSSDANKATIVEDDLDISGLGVNELPFIMAGYMTENSEHDEVHVAGHFNGKIDRPRVAGRALEREEMKSLLEGRSSLSAADRIVGAWDFSEEITRKGIRSPETITDIGPHGLRGRAVQLPTRAVTGYNWTGETTHFVHAPDEYGAIHFHEDDLSDAGWDVDLEWNVPEDRESGAYALRLRTDSDEYFIPFFVRPPRGTSTADIALLAPTNSYLAYANDRFAATEFGWQTLENHYSAVAWFDEHDLFLSTHPEYGLSSYDQHPDGHGSMYSSRLRPLLSMSPKVMAWGGNPSHLHQYNADTHLINWLEELDYRYDVITDEDLQAEGVDLLNHYNVIITGHHPEYYSLGEWHAIREYQKSGGRFMYLGGNGFYWVISHHPNTPQIIEVRRGETGTETWVADPGETFMAFDGEKGGVLRRRKRPPQKLTGIGFSAQYDPRGTYYRRNSDSYEDDVAFVFDGVDKDVFGDFGYMGGGAAGQEIDRYDTELGSPEHAYVLATSEGHTEYARQVHEELAITEQHVDGRMNPHVRADLVYYKTEMDGAVFSVGSMTWIGSLCYNECDNAVSTITKNVLDRFASDNPLP